MIIAVIGAGGKTTRIHQLADHYVKERKKVLITTSTHMLVEKGMLLTSAEDLSSFRKEIESRLEEKPLLVVGSPCRTKDGSLKFQGLPEQAYLVLADMADILLVEADGANHHLCKYPAAWEPAIPANADCVELIMSLDALGRPAAEVMHRFPLACKLLGLKEDVIVDQALLERLIREGYQVDPEAEEAVIPVRKAWSAEKSGAKDALLKNVVSSKKAGSVKKIEPEAATLMQETGDEELVSYKPVLVLGSFRQGDCMCYLPWKEVEADE